MEILARHKILVSLFRSCAIDVHEMLSSDAAHLGDALAQQPERGLVPSVLDSSRRVRLGAHTQHPLP